MQERSTSLKPISLAIAMVAMMASCQEPAMEVSLPDEDQAFTRASVVAQQIRKMALKDGSDDNVLDNASCLTVVLPVTGTLAGKSFTISTPADITVLQDIYYLNIYQSDRFLLDFPLRVIKSDHTEVAVSSQEELDILAAGCVENGLDDDIECVDIEYPVSVATYDLQNQIAAVKNISDDATFFRLFNEYADDDLMGIQFPISVVTPNGVATIGGNFALQNVFNGELDVCDEGDKVFYSKKPLVTEKLTLSLTDAPFPLELIDEANVTIFKIELKTGPENDSIPFVTLFNEPQAFNLLDLTNGNTVQLSETELPVGTYSSFNVYVTDGTVVLKDGQVFELKIPSGDKSGIKVKPATALEIKEGESAAFLLDFDLSQSFVVKGNPNTPAGINGFNFKPVIRASDTSQSGILSGAVTDQGGAGLYGAQVSVYAADTLNTTAFSNEDGDFKILGLTPGAYQVQAELNGYQLSTMENITVEKGKETTVAISLTNN